MNASQKGDKMEDKLVPFFSAGGAAFAGMRCVGISGKAKVKDFKWLQSYTMTFKMVATQYLEDLLYTPAGMLKSAPLDDLDVRVGFYPYDEGAPTVTVDAIVSIQVVTGNCAEIKVTAKVERPKCKDDKEYLYSLPMLSHWLERKGALILRPRRCDDTLDMFDNGQIPPLTIHRRFFEPVQTRATGEDLLAELRGEEDYDDAAAYVGSAEVE